MILGLLFLGGATVMLCVGNSIAVLATGRVLQGISAAVSWVVGMALVVDTVGPEESGQAMGYVGLSMSLAMLVAPLLGGVVFASAGYYAVFAMAFGLMALDIFLRLVLIEKKVAVKWLPAVTDGNEVKKQEAAMNNGASVTDVEMADIPSDRIQTQQLADQPEQRVGPESDVPKLSTRSAADEVLPATTPSMIKRFSARLPPVVFLLASRRLLTALWACVIQSTLVTAFDATLPLFVRNTFHWNSTGAGLIFLPLVIVSFLGPVVGWLSDKHGPRWYPTAGYMLNCPCLILLRLVHKDTMDQKVLLCALLTLVGICLTLALTPIMAEIAYAVDAKAARRPPGFFGKNGAYAQAYSLFNMAWALGALVGPLLAGLVNQTHGWGSATLILGCISGFTAIPVAVWTGGSIFKQRKRRKEERAAGPGGVVEGSREA